MRQLKFRVWHINGKRFIDLNGFSISFKSMMVVGIVYGVTEQGVLREYDADEVIIEQFTGLTDKNGKEIYEGDIVNFHIFTQELGEGLGVYEGEKEWIGEIAIQELGLWIQGNIEDDCGYLLFYDGLHEESFEVIGNIHENPELLIK